MSNQPNPHHGGKLLQAAMQYRRPVEQWLDLSTGVSPYYYPVPNIPPQVWNRLPEEEDGLLEAAAQYYQHTSLLAVAGSQAAIQALPEALSQTVTIERVLLPAVGYKEHQYAWQLHQQRSNGLVAIEFYHHQPTSQQLQSADVVVVINPNNPSSEKYSANQLLSWRQHMANDSLLIVDEAFMDCTPDDSLLNQLPEPIPSHTLILRSVGKFFGLAGVRVGFCFAHPTHLNNLNQKLGPWTLSGPSRYIVKHALLNTEWQHRNRETLLANGARMHALLSQYFTDVHPQILFHRVELTNAIEWHHALATHGILTRLCDEQDAVRFGLPRQESHWLQLESALQQIKDTL